MMNRITCEEALAALEKMRLSETAESIGLAMGADPKAVTRALKPAVKDGRVTVAFKGETVRYRLAKKTVAA